MSGETITHRGIEIKIEQDDNPENPRDDDNLGTIAAFHRRYSCGNDKDKHSLRHEDFSGWDAMEAHIRRVLKAVIVLPLYLYDHSVQHLSTKSFHGRAQHAEWDSGRVGFIFVTRETLLKEHSAKRVTKKMIEQATRVLEGEVETFDQYMSGDVWGYIIEGVTQKYFTGGRWHTHDGDSCWGFYGYDYCVEEAKSVADGYADAREKTVQAECNQGDGI